MFLNPLFLAGTALVVVPIVLHLLMRPRPKHLLFPALRFIRQRHDVNRRQMRLRNWLLLLLRAAVICLLALALARPSIQGNAGGIGAREGPVAAAFVFDTLPRMSYRHENQTRLEAAQAFGASLLGELPEESRVAVLDAATTLPTFQVDLGGANHRIERLEPRAVGRALSKVAIDAAGLLKTSDLPKEIYLFSDLSRAAWDPGDAAELTAALESLGLTGVYLIDVGVEHPQNYALGEVRLPGQSLAKNTALNLRCELSSRGVSGQRVVESYLLGRQGQAEKRSQEIVELAEGESAAIEFVLGGLDEGTHQGFLRIVGGDALAADDTRYFTVDVRPAWKVLVAAPEPAEDYAFYLTEALAPQAFRKNGQARFDCDVIGYPRLAEAPLERYAAVVLLDPPPLADAVWQQIGAFAQAGGGVAVCVGDAAQPVASFNSAAAAEVLPAKLDLVARHPQGDVSLAPDDSQHPLLEKFRPLRGTIGWDAFPVYRYWQVTALTPGAQTVAAYSDGDPAILERPLGRGRVLLLTTPVSESPHASAGDRWNLLATGFEPWPFVMLANEMTLYLAGSSDTQFNYLAGQTATIRVQPGQRHPTYLLTPPSGDSERIAADPARNVIVVAATPEAGDYRIAAGGANAGVHLGFSVNLSPDATQLQRIEPEQLKQLFGKVNVRIARSRDQLDREVSTSRVGRELFGMLIAAMALVLGLEHVLANRFYQAPGSGLRAPAGKKQPVARSP
ncbi:MAG TPA: BatA domain-containing protein [Pirellulales bacterium]|jgi:hypothetical protein|nr:BatA domain-containing protein [Pirellulales bacterium]